MERIAVELVGGRWWMAGALAGTDAGFGGERTELASAAAPVWRERRSPRRVMKKGGMAHEANGLLQEGRAPMRRGPAFS
jgi:hypothetical protein